MQEFVSAILEAIRLVATLDSDLFEIVGLSMRVSLTAVAIACLIGLPVGASLAIANFPGRRFIVVTINALMGLPPVVVGLIVYLLLSNTGPLGWLELLYSPTAMIIAQTILVMPIVAALCIARAPYLPNLALNFQRIRKFGYGILPPKFAIWYCLNVQPKPQG